MNIKKIDSKFLNDNHEISNSILVYVFHQLKDMSLSYPQFDIWFKKVLLGIQLGERSILLEYRQDNLAGIAILKNNKEEKKLCCLRVLSPYEGSGVGIKLFNRAFDELNTKSPLLSITNEKLINFERIFDYYGFKIEEKYPDLYLPDKTEISFNGILLI